MAFFRPPFEPPPFMPPFPGFDPDAFAVKMVMDIQMFKGQAEDALMKNDLRKAISFYTKAIDYLRSLADPIELGINLSNRAMVFIKMKKYKEAVEDVLESIHMHPQFHKSYWRGGIALKELHQTEKAFNFFMAGLKMCPPESRADFLLEIIALLPQIPEELIVVDVREFNFHQGTWSKVISQLASKNKWLIIKLLVLGTQETRWSLFSGIAKTCCKEGIRLQKLLESVGDTDMRNWGVKLLVLLIQYGASLDELGNDLKQNTLHYSVDLALRTGCLDLLKYITENIATSPNEKNVLDDNGDTVLHRLVKSGQVNTTAGESALRYLLDNGYSVLVKDSTGKIPLAYVRPNEHAHGILKSALPKLASVEPDCFQSSEMMAKSCKEKGNDLYKKSRYREALGCYNKAIDILKDMLESEGENEDIRNHDFSVLFGNCVECHLKLDDLKHAEEAAQESVSYDAHWFKSHLRIGKVQKRLGDTEKSLRAYLNSLNYLDNSNINAKMEILPELTEVISKKHKVIPLDYTVLYKIYPNMWARVALVLAEKKSWKPAQTAYRMVKNFSPSQQLNANEDVRCLCNLQMLQTHSWLIELLMYFLRSGADYRRLGFVEGDTYLHASVRICLISGGNWTEFFDQNVWRKLERSKDVSLPDQDKNSPLHLITQDRQIPLDVKTRLLKIFMDLGVDPHIMNQNGQKAIDHLKKTEIELKKELQNYMKRIPDKSQNKAKGNRNQEHTRFSSPAGNVQEQKKATKKKTSSKQYDDPCVNCEKQFEEADALMKINNQNKAYNILNKIMSISNHKREMHQKITDKCFTAVLNDLLKSVNPDIPTSFTNFSESVSSQIVRKLMELDKWKHAAILVKTFKHRQGTNALCEFAADMPVVPLLKSGSLYGAPELRLEMLRLMMSCGGTIEFKGDKMKGQSALKALIDAQKFKLVIPLLDFGSNPMALSIENGDTPFHAALNIALNKEKGDFSILEKLYEIVQEHGNNYPDLHPTKGDENGDSLFHVVTKCSYNKHVQKAIEILCDWKLWANVKNNEGKVPLDYLKTKNDRRIQFLKLRSGPTATVKKSQDKKKSGKGSSKIIPSSQKVTDKPHCTSEENTDTVVSIKSEVISSVPSRQMLRSSILAILNSLPDYNMTFEKFDAIEEEKSLARNILDEEVNKEDTDSEYEDASASQNNARDIKYSHASDDDEFYDCVDEKTGDTFEQAIDIDPSLFDNLEWEVECTAEVWRCLRSNHMPQDLKERAIKKIQLLASGDWLPHLRRKLHGVPDIRLFEINLTKAARIIWEIAIAFSPRLSSYTETSSSTAERDSDTLLKGGRIYSEVIRIWDIVLDHDKLYRSVDRIKKSHERGESCILQKRLKGTKQPGSPCKTGKRYPMLYAESDVDAKALRDLQSALEKFFPPASANESEYHILKFYSFSSMLVQHVLKNIEAKVDFPFRVTDLEHAVINLASGAPVLLIGRSGTGKTTCCLYRLWSRFLSYWMKAREADAPLLPRTIDYIHSQQGAEETDDSEGSETEEEDAGDTEAQAAASIKNNEDKLADDESSEKKDELPIVEYDHLHQIFITKNPVLCSEVLKNFRELSHASDITQDHVAVEEEALANRLQDISEYHYPLFVTSKQLLLMLDASMEGNCFFERKDDGSLKVEVQGWTETDGPLSYIPDFDEDFEDDQDDEEEPRAAALDDVAFDEEQAPANRQIQVKRDPRREVTYEVFAEEVWLKIKKKADTDYHPTLVWTEIMSFIKGSSEALVRPKGYLSKDEYLELGRKRAPNFSGERDIVYEIFKHYNQYCRQHALFDEADLVFQMYQRLVKYFEFPWVIHQIFVDETQDFTQAELCLLIRLCQNPNEMFLTGDTAQSIMRGIAFRFSDLKSLFFNVKESTKAMGKASAVIVPRQVHQLTHNYRSHAGILSLASSILDLMVDFFPESFDRLQKDQGLFNGPLPVLIESCSFSDLALLLKGNKRKTSHIEFGAHQAILVVNDAARDGLPEELRMGLVLTIFEAKGLEFDDILLYNFFKDSQARKEWRVVTHYLQRMVDARVERQEDDFAANNCGLFEIDESVLSQPNRPRPLEFCPSQHKVLCSELKHLYTALTRARVNVWIFDEDLDMRAPMFEYFKVMKFVRYVTVNSESESYGEMMFTESSSAEDWIKRGDEVLKRSLYEVAAKCYRMGGDAKKEQIALTHHQALAASRITDNPKKMREEFLKAAKQYLDCNLLSKAVLCLWNAREKEMAAVVYEKLGQFDSAAKIYHKIRKPLDASRCYEQNRMFNKAIDVLCEYEYYDMAVDVLQRYQMLVKGSTSEAAVQFVLIQNKPRKIHTVENLSYKSAELHHNHNNHSGMLGALDRLPNVDSRVDFLKKRKHFEDAAGILQKNGDVAEAIKLLLLSGKIDEALRLAKGSEDLRFIAYASLCKAKIYMEYPGNDEEEIKKQAEKLLRDSLTCYLAEGDNNGIGEANLSLAQLLNEQQFVKSAFVAFLNAKPPNIAGQLACIELCHDLFSGSKHIPDLQNLIRGVSKLVKVVSCLCKPSTNDEKFLQEQCARFYGLHVVDKEEIRINTRENPRCLSMLKLTKQERKHREVIRGRNETFHDLCSHHLTRAVEWIEKLKIWLKDAVTSITTCPKYAAGYDCDCQLPHQPQDENQIRDLVIFLSFQVVLDSIIHDVEYHKLFSQYPDLQMLWEDILELTSDDSCEDLLNFLHSPHSHPKFSTSSSNVGWLQRNLHAIFSQIKNPIISKQMKRYLEWNDEQLKWSMMSTDYMVRVAFWNHLFGFNFDAWKMLEEIEAGGSRNKDVQRLFNEHVFMTVKSNRFQYDNTNVYYLGIARRFLDSIEYLIEGNPFESLIKFTQFIVLNSHKARHRCLPDFTILCFWLEYYTAVAFMIGAKLKLYGTDSVRYFLPERYLHITHFVDVTLKSSNKGYRFLQDSINVWKPKPKETMETVRDRLKRIIDLLIGFEKSRINLLQKVLQISEEDPTPYLLAERVVVLCLVLICNVGGCVAADCELPLLNSIQEIEITEQMPDRLSVLINAIRQARGIADIAEVTIQFLKKRDDVFLECQWHYQTEHRQGTHFTRLETYSAFNPKFFSDSQNPNLLSETVSSEDDFEISDKEKEQFEKNFERTDNENETATEESQANRLVSSPESSQTVSKQLEGDKQNEFSPFTVDETMCGICSVFFKSPDEEEHFMSENVRDTSISQMLITQSTSEGHDLRSGSNFNQNARSSCTPEELKTQHVQSREHIQKQFEFRSYKHTYQTLIANGMEIIGKFVNDYEMKDENLLKTIYFDVTGWTTKLFAALQKVEQEHRNIMSARQWSNTDSLLRYFEEARKYWHLIRDSADIIKKMYGEHQAKLQASKEEEECVVEQKKAKSADDTVDEVEEMHKVVEGPKTPSNYKMHREYQGRGRGYGRRRGSWRGNRR